MLDIFKQTRIEHRKKTKKKQEYKFLGSCMRKRGQRLFAYDVTIDEVYEIKLEKRTALNLMTKKEKSGYKVHVNSNHPHLFALNKKNAIRKFIKMFNPKLN